MSTDLTSLLDSFLLQTTVLLEREFPNGLYIQFDERLKDFAPRDRFPSFYGCYDWHSAVHSHWQLVRACRVHPDSIHRSAVLDLFERHFSQTALDQEFKVFQSSPFFEFPYGQAWLLMLCAELKAWDEPRANKWAGNFSRLEAHAAQQFVILCQKYTVPIRTGTHRQTAFNLGLVYDWALASNHAELLSLIGETVNRFYELDTDAPVRYEPSAHDFLSPTLAEADLVARVLPQALFVPWLMTFLPIESLDYFQPVEIVDPSDGHLAHFAGLNLSRAWMMRRIAHKFEAGTPYHEKLLYLADEHIDQGLLLASHPDYMISHWVPTFAVYLLTQVL